MRKHPLRLAKEGDYFAVALSEKVNCYIRVYRSWSIGVLPVCSSGGVLSLDIVSNLRPVAYFFLLALNDDPTLVKLIGTIPFVTKSESEPPACVKPADDYINYHQIYHLGRDRRATDVEIQGLQRWKMAPMHTLVKTILEISADWPVITLPPTT